MANIFPIKAFLVDWAFEKGIIAEGIVDGKIIDKEYMKINGELHHVNTLFKDTPENRSFIQDILGLRKELKAAVDRHFFESLNEISRRKMRVTDE